MLPLEDSRLLKPAKSSTLAPSPLQTKPPSAPRVHSSSSPSSAYQAYRQGERDSYSASKPKPAAHPHLPSGHISSPPRPAVRKESEWSPADEKAAIRRAQNTITPAKPAKPLVTKEDDARETRRFHNQVAAARQPSAPPRVYPANFIGPVAPGGTRQSSPPKPESSKPRVAPANFIGPIAPGVRRAAPSNPAPATRPKPALGTAGDLAAATKASQDASKALADFRKDHTLSNRGGLRQESEMALRQAENVANKRYAAAKAEKAAQDAPAAIPTSLNRGGVRQEAINDARREASSARTTYLNSQGLDSSGKPVVVSPPKPPVPDRPKEKNLWDEVTGFVKANPMEVVHGALDVAGFIPGAGAVFDGANAVLYLAEGDKTNAALSAVAAIPGVGDAVAATAIAGKVAVKGAKALEVVTKVEKSTEALPTAVKSISRKDNVPFRNSQTFRSLLKDMKLDSSEVVAGHGHAVTSGRREMLGLEARELNQVKKTETRRFIDHKGRPIEVETAKKLEGAGKLPKGTVGSARSHPGWTRSVKINPRGVDVVEGRFDKDQVLRLKEISRAQLGKDISQAKLRGESVRAERLQEKLNEDISQAKLRGETFQSKPIDRRSSKDRNLYEHYLQSLRDSAPRSKTGGTPSHLDFEQPRGQYNLRAPGR
jgi:hypothetical protein